jgi:hypothetical protein
MNTIPISRIAAFSSVFLLAVSGYAIFCCIAKVRYAAGSSTSVGDDVIVIGYAATVGTTLLSSLAVFIARNETAALRALPIAALLGGIGALGLWSWLHLSGVVVPYSSLMKP